jgi:hypothetical protein
LNAEEALTAYYEASGNPPGRWHGTGLAGLGTDDARLRAGDQVSEEAMGAVFGAGRDPITGDPLGRPYATYRAAPRGGGHGWGESPGGHGTRSSGTT